MQDRSEEIVKLLSDIRAELSRITSWWSGLVIAVAVLVSLFLLILWGSTVGSGD